MRALILMAALCGCTNMDAGRFEPVDPNGDTETDGLAPPLDVNPFAYAPCPHPDGVTFVQSGATITSPLPAGVFYDDPIGGCLSVVVSAPTPSSEVLVTATVHGCATWIRLPPSFHISDDGGYTEVQGSATISIAAEWCYSELRGIIASGFMSLAIDPDTSTLTTAGLQADISSAPHYDCGCTP